MRSSAPGAGGSLLEGSGRPADRDLAARAIAGDRAAEEALYRTHAGRVFAVARRLSGSASLAEELTQDVFLRVFQRLPTFRGESALSTWLHRLAVRVIIDELRRSRLERAARDPGAGDPGPEPAGPAGIERGEALDLERSIARLPQGAREVLVLYDVEGYQHDEIAELLGISIGTSKSQLFRARRMMREALCR